MSEIHSVLASSLFLLASLGFGPGATAQGRTLIVDAAGGAGVFRDLQPAVDAAKSGDTIRVRKGDYGGANIRRKALRILADPGARVKVGRQQSLIVSGVPAGSRLVVRGLRFEPSIGSQIACIGNPGTVVFEGVELAGRFSLCDFTHSHWVHIERCKFQGSAMFQSGTSASIVDSVFQGITRAPTTAKKQFPTVLLTGSTGREFFVTRSSILGANAGASDELPGAAIEANGRVRVVIRGSGQDLIRAGAGRLARSAIVDPFSGSHELVLDPRVRIAGNANAPALDWHGPRTTRRSATLTSTPFRLGTTATMSLTAEPQYLHVLLLGQPVPPTTIPSVGELSLSSPLPWVAGSTGSGASASYAIPVPNWPSLRGLTLAWQVAGQSPRTAVRLSNASLSTID